MVQPKRPTNKTTAAARQFEGSSSSSSSSNPYVTFVVKILLVLLILLLLPKLVESGTSRHNQKYRRMTQQAHVEFHSLQNHCDTQVCQQYFPEERMNCIALCMSPACFQQVYADAEDAILEPGEVAPVDRARSFEDCVKEHLRQARQRRKEDLLAMEAAESMEA